MKRSLVVVVVTLAVAFVPACGGISSSEGSGGGGTGGSGGAAGSSGQGGSGASGGFGGGTSLCGSATCNQLEQCFDNQYCVTKLVPITGGYSIDATEVTRSQYASWLSTNPPTSDLPSYCDWNHAPSCEWPPGAKGDHPVVCVDWCDAYAYCKAVGKRLCGRVGGGMNDYDDYANASTSQWYAACSSGGTNDYPYGDTYSGTTCNGVESGDGTIAVAGMSGCQSSVSGYTGVYDLSGNVWEWEDSCNGNSGTLDYCRVRGGCFLSGASSLRCVVDVLYSWGRGFNVDYLGFRCCSDP